MKTRILFISTLMTIINCVSGQEVTGDWNGALKVGGMQLRLVFHVNKTDKGLSATMDSPDQGQKNIPMSKVQYENNLLAIEMAAARINYTGTFNGKDSVIGTFTQSGQKFPMNLNRKTIEKVETKRPQEPLKPYPYYSEEVTFENRKDNITLAGTLTLPKKDGKYPVVVLITGSGPQNRDEELMGHKPFLVLADYLTRNGFGVLRYDDRGCFSSKGNFSKSTTFDFATDVESAVKYLKTRKDIDCNKIGLIGHSEGGIIAPMVAFSCKEVSFIVLMAGTGVSGSNLLLKQQNAIGKTSGMSENELKNSAEINREIYEVVNNTTDSVKIKSEITRILKQKINQLKDLETLKGMSEEDIIKQNILQLSSPWILNFIRYNPAPMLEKVKCPVLAMNGDKDLQVDAKINLTAIENALKKGGNKKFTIKEFPGLNHLFQECKTGAPKEYAEIEQTISPLALETITSWLKKTLNP